MARAALVAALIFGMISPVFADDLQQSIATQATLLARAPTAQPPARAQGQAPPPGNVSGNRGNKESTLLMIAGIGLVGYGATLVAYGSGQFGNCAGSQASTQIYSNANECYSQKISGWMLGVGAGSVLILGSLFTRNK